MCLSCPVLAQCALSAKADKADGVIRAATACRRADKAQREDTNEALDRVLLAHDYVVPQWTYPYTRTARWDRFGRPDPMPKYGAPLFPSLWWWDAEKAKKAGAGK